MIEPMEIGSSPAEAMLVRRAYSRISQAALENEIGDGDDTAVKASLVEVIPDTFRITLPTKVGL